MEDNLPQVTQCGDDIKCSNCEVDEIITVNGEKAIFIKLSDGKIWYLNEYEYKTDENINFSSKEEAYKFALESFMCLASDLQEKLDKVEKIISGRE